MLNSIRKKNFREISQKIRKIKNCLPIGPLLDTLTDLHETLGVYTVRPELYHGVLFHFRSDPQNRKLAMLP